MAQQTLLKKFAYTLLLGASLLTGCYEPEQMADTPRVRIDTVKVIVPVKDTLGNPVVVDKPDTVKIPGNGTGIGGPDTLKPITPDCGWDDFPNKSVPCLDELATRIRLLPTPLGTRYNAPLIDKPLSKVSADTLCPDGPREIYGHTSADKMLHIVDTIRYYNTNGEASCRWHTLNMVRETHNRRVIDIRSGQSWEFLVDSVSEQDVLPRHSITGTGYMKLNNGLDITIDSYKVQYYTPYSDPGALITGGHLKLSLANGTAFSFTIAKALPFKADDLFPVRGTPAVGDRVMSGPITYGGETIGFADLFADHTVLIRDKGGKLVLPKQ